MKITFRIECPHCNWGYKWSDGYINMGWLKLTCCHCNKEFYTKVTINDIGIQVSKDLAEGLPCMKWGES